MASTPGRRDVVFKAGDDAVLFFTKLSTKLTDVDTGEPTGEVITRDHADLLASTWNAQIRHRPGPAGVQLGAIAISIVDDKLRLSVDHDTTQSIGHRPGGPFAWDLQETRPDGSVQTWLEGWVTVLPDVTFGTL